MKKIIQIVESVFETDLKDKERSKLIVYARKAYCHLARKYTTASTTEIGKSIGIDHSTVIHHSENESFGAEAIAKFDKGFREMLNECEAQINDLDEDRPPFKVLLQQRLDALQIGEVVSIQRTENGFEFC